MTPDFDNMLLEANAAPLEFESLRTLQINLGNRCNQKCAHCHVQAGPEGKRIMPPRVINRIAAFLAKHTPLSIDVTGGCPELNPHYALFLERIRPLASEMMVRTNFTVLLEPRLQWIPEWYRDNEVTIIGSLPCYTEENVDKQRGPHVFQKSIEAIRILNDLGYARDPNLQLNLVYNPGADFLPASQQQLEENYRDHLRTEHNVEFNNLFTITNAPIGRFRQYLIANGLLQSYLDMLVQNFNPLAAQNVMCRTLLSIDYRGIIYNCDFNQALELPIIDEKGQTVTIVNLEQILSERIEIITGPHCFCCTAAAGSSCTGSLTK
ncbi:MAG: arsenosugar biosynthesis radical SAM (seleno)protein ArsS [Planctomycetota bacterium]|jgi:radical SAM/Cys-rich protein